MLYKGSMQDDVEKERSLTVFQLSKVKFEVEKHSEGIHVLKSENSELRKRIKRYSDLIVE